MLTAVLVFLALAVPAVALAQTASNQVVNGLQATQPALGLATTDIRTMVALIIRYFFGLLGLVAVSLVIYGGYVYMMARGDATETDRAKKILTNAFIGLLIIMMAYGIAELVIRFILQGTSGGGQFGGGGGGTAVTAGYCQGCGPEQLGNGIVSYHYPEASQTDIPRNVSIAISFKKPILRSTVLKNYYDGQDASGNPTYELTDDRRCDPNQPMPADPSTCPAVCPDPGNTATCDKNCTDPSNLSTCTAVSYVLNADNVKVLPTADLQEISGSTTDARFDSRYASGSLLTGAAVSLTEVEPANFDINNSGQTLVIVPDALLGSSQQTVEYRVGLRGGQTGLRDWSWDSAAGQAKAEDSFSQLNPDGSYFWNFTTSILVDLTPPTVTANVPASVKDPYGSGADRLYMNQLLQVYFSKAMNPVTVSGTNGTATGLEVQYEASPGVWQVLSGKWVVAAGYKSVEFTPDQPCAGVSENSCGQKVYCLPANTKLAVTVRPSAPSEAPPRSVIPYTGAVDLVSNVLDGNGDGTVDGPGSANPSGYTQNSQVIAGTSVRANFAKDTALWLYTVGDQMDLDPPYVESVDPTDANPSGAYAGGASKFPATNPIVAVWSEPISITSIVTGPDTYSPATVTLRAKETPKGGATPGVPWYTVEPQLVAGGTPPDTQRSKLVMKHRAFFTSNDLGWSATDTDPNMIPVYVPVFKSRLKDSRQNCFFPSKSADCAATNSSPYCCDRSSSGQGGYESGVCKNLK